MSVENEHFVDEALRLVAGAERDGIRLRILGSLAYRLHCPNNIQMFEKMERALTDIDFAAHRRQSRAIREFITAEGYRVDERVTMATEGSRYFFEHPQTKLGVDIFMDELYFCHPIPLSDRLGLDSPTIPLADLVLEKMQIVEINLKDIKDTIVLFVEHEVGNSADGRETVDAAYIAGMLGQDWGFYYTVTENLKMLERSIPDFDAVSKSDLGVITRRVHQLLETIEQAPKTRKWKMRAKVGTRKRWYQEVNEKGTTF